MTERSRQAQDLPKRNGLGQTPLRRKAWGEDRRIAFQTEASFQRQVEQLARILGWYSWHINLPMRSKAGFPDCLFIRERVVWAELKVWSPTTGKMGKLTAEQMQFQEMLKMAGQETYVWWDCNEDWEEIQKVLAKI